MLNSINWKNDLASIISVFLSHTHKVLEYVPDSEAVKKYEC